MNNNALFAQRKKADTMSFLICASIQILSKNHAAPLQIFVVSVMSCEYVQKKKKSEWKEQH